MKRIYEKPLCELIYCENDSDFLVNSQSNNIPWWTQDSSEDVYGLFDEPDEK